MDMTSEHENQGRVLIVEDDESAAVFVTRVLERAGFESSWAIDADQASVLLADTNFHVLLTDFRLPGRSGLEPRERDANHAARNRDRSDDVVQRAGPRAQGTLTRSRRLLREAADRIDTRLAHRDARRASQVQRALPAHISAGPGGQCRAGGCGAGGPSRGDPRTAAIQSFHHRLRERCRRSRPEWGI